MQHAADPYRVLGLERGATVAEVKRAYRRLAKASHPDAAGPRGVARFLAVQAAYQAIAVELAVAAGSRSARRQDASASPAERNPARRWTSRRDRPRGEQTDGGARQAAPDRGAGGPADDARARSERDREEAASRRTARLGSTSYDDATEFEPSWEGASWYGQVSGTYWTVNPREYADPRKHGPEYLARAAAEERAAAGHRAAAEERATADADVDAADAADAADTADAAEHWT